MGGREMKRKHNEGGGRYIELFRERREEKESLVRRI
jgi:hypothetical protein